ncbi:MAG: rhodanese-like domain-containing protein [Ginsengibacter sp.]
MKKNKTTTIIIDVRNPVDFEKGHAPESINIPLPEMESKLDEIKKLKDPVIVVCGGGTRNKKAHELLKEHGIKSTAGGSWKDY